MAPRFLKRTLGPVATAVDNAGESVDNLRYDLRAQVDQVTPFLAIIAVSLLVIASCMIAEVLIGDD